MTIQDLERYAAECEAQINSLDYLNETMKGCGNYEAAFIALKCELIGVNKLLLKAMQYNRLNNIPCH